MEQNIEENNDQTPTELYMKAVQKLRTWSVHDTAEIVSLLERVLEIDPNYYRAYTTLCQCYTWMGALKQVSPETASQKVNLCLSYLKNKNHALPEYFTLLAKRNFWIEWNNSTAVRNCNRALEIQQNCGDALLLKGLIKASQGKPDSALKFLLQAEQLDPLTANINYFIGLIHFYSKRFEQALTYFDRTIQISPSWHQPFHEKHLCLCHLNQFDSAEQLIEDLRKKHDSLLISFLEIQLQISRGETNQIAKLRELEATLDTDCEQKAPYLSYLAELYLQVGLSDTALILLQSAVQKKATPLVFLAINHIWDTYRTDPRFITQTNTMFAPSKKATYSKSSLPADLIDSLSFKLDTVMNNKKPWLDPHFDREQCARMLSIQNCHLSQYINSHLRCTFSDYVNQFRLAHFLSLAHDTAYGHLSILQKSFDSGFASKTTFNTFFKKQKGTTPREYLSRI